MYYLGGKVETLEDVEARATDRERTLLSNMRNNKWEKIVTTATPWQWTQPLNPTDVVLEWEQ